MVDEKKSAASDIALSKDVFVLIPLFASGLAITYDVGFFTGLGGAQFFSFFSLAEHIVFAVQVLPMAIVLVALYTAVIYYRSAVIEKQSSNSAHKRPPPETKNRFSIAVLGILVGFGAYHFDFIDSFLLTGLIVGLLAVPSFLTAKAVWSRAMVGIVTFMVWAFGFGYTHGLHPQGGLPLIGIDSRPSKISTKHGGQIEAILITSGERGVLIFDPKTNQLTLQRWDEIVQISTPR